MKKISKLILTLFAVLLSSLSLSNLTFAKTTYDNVIKNQQPLKFTIWKRTANKKYTSKTETFNNIDQLISEYTFNSEDLNKYNKLAKTGGSLDFSSVNHWAILKTDDYNYSTWLGPKIRSTAYIITTKSKNFSFKPFMKDTINGPKSAWKLASSNPNDTIRVHKVYSVDYDTAPYKYFVLFNYEDKKEFTLESYRYYKHYSFVNNFNIEYPNNYEGDSFLNKYYPTRYSNFSYRVKENKLTAIVDDNIFYADKYNFYWTLKYIPKDSTTSKTIFSNKKVDILYYDINENQVGKYFLTLNVSIRSPYLPQYKWRSKTLSFDYKDITTAFVDSTNYDEEFLPSSQFKYENCDVTDFSCHVRNIFTKISKTFFYFKKWIKSFFIPADKTFLIKVFQDFKKFLNTKLGFLVYPIDFVLRTSELLILQKPICVIGRSGSDATSQLFPNGVLIDFCSVKNQLGRLYDFAILFVRGSILVCLLVWIKKVYERILSL